MAGKSAKSQKGAKVSELFVYACTRAVSDRFGLPALNEDKCTSSGLPLSDDPHVGERAKVWLSEIVAKFDWVMKSKAKIPEERAFDVVALMLRAMSNDEVAVMQLRASCQ